MRIRSILITTATISQLIVLLLLVVIDNDNVVVVEAGNPLKRFLMRDRKDKKQNPKNTAPEVVADSDLVVDSDDQDSVAIEDDVEPMQERGEDEITDNEESIPETEVQEEILADDQPQQDNFADETVDDEDDDDDDDPSDKSGQVFDVIDDDDEPHNVAREHPVTVCTSPEALEEAKNELAKRNAEYENVQQDLVNAKFRMEQIQHEKEQYSIVMEQHLDKITVSSETAAQNIGKTQKEFSSHLNRIQQQSDTELADVRAMLVAKEAELQQVKSDLTDRLHSEKLSAAMREQETDSEWRQGLANAESVSSVHREQLEDGYRDEIRTLQDTVATLRGEKKAHKEMYDNLEVKYENIIRDQKKALQIYLEDNLAKAVDIQIVGRLDDVVAAHNRTKLEYYQLLDTSTATIVEWENKYTNLTKSSKEQYDDIVSTWETRYDELKTTSDSKYKDTVQKWETKYSILKDTTSKELNVTIMEWETKYNELNETTTKQYEDTVQEWETKYRSLESTTSMELNSTIMEWETKYMELNETTTKRYEDTVATMNQEHEAQHQNLLSSHTSELTKLHSDTNQTITDLKQSHEISLTDVTTQLSAVTIERSTLLATTQQQQRQLESITKQLQNVTLVADEWKHRFDERSYINATQITNDAAAYTYAKTKQATDVLASTAEPYYEGSKRVFKSHVVDPYTKHLHPTVVAAGDRAMPVYNSYAEPKVKILQKHASDSKLSMYAQLQQWFRNLVHTLHTTCTTNKYTPPSDASSASYYDSLQHQVCEKPDDTVLTVLKVVGVALIVLLRWRIWWAVVWLVFTALAIVWYLSPLRVIIQKLFVRQQQKESSQLDIPSQQLDIATSPVAIAAKKQLNGSSLLLQMKKAQEI